MSPDAPAASGWLRQVVGTLRTHWRPLLAISLVTELAIWIASAPLLLLPYDRLFDSGHLRAGLAVVHLVPAVLGGWCTAWCYTAMVAVLREWAPGRPVRLAAVLAPAARECGRLAAWLIGIELVFGLRSLWFQVTLLEDPSAYWSVMAMTTPIAIAAWYVRFATELLPFVVLDRSGALRRSWWLVHSRFATALQVAVVLAVGWAVDEFVADLTRGAWTLYRLPVVWRSVVESVVGVLVSTLTIVALATAYARRLPRPEAVPEPDPADPAEPVVIDLGTR